MYKHSGIYIIQEYWIESLLYPPNTFTGIEISSNIMSVSLYVIGNELFQLLMGLSFA